jgi:glycosyltransferase involved in cell wall biosynthesis
VPRQDKYDAFAAAALFCMPSVHESFSLVIMESWLMGTPILVHGDCAVTTEHCRRANGGLYFSNYPEFAATVTYLLDHPQIAQTMGRLGARYVLANYQWDTIIDKYHHVLAEVASSPPPAGTAR